MRSPTSEAPLGLATRAITNSGTLDGTSHYVYDQWGNLIAELDGTGATVREYIWLLETEIAPTMDGPAQVDRPIAVVSGVATATPSLLMVHVDHLNRPVKMTDASRAVVWDAVWLPWGGAFSITGSQSLDARFPGQWFQLEAGLHYNWHRHYDPSLGRYTQPDPLGFVDGPSVYAYANGNSVVYVDKDGRFVWLVPYIIGGAIGGGTDLLFQLYENDWKWECVNPWEVAGSAALGAAIKGPYWWGSSRSAGGGARLWKNGPGIDWHRFNFGGRTVNRLHYHRGLTKSQLKKHRPWDGGW